MSTAGCHEKEIFGLIFVCFSKKCRQARTTVFSELLVLFAMICHAQLLN